MQTIISPSILAADFACLRDQIQEAQAGGADWIHIDVMDGQFVPNITMGPLIVDTCREITSLPLDVHLMIEQPEKHVEAFARAGADYLTIHIETNPHIYRTLQWIRDLGCKPGIVLNPGTPASSVDSVLHLVDLVLVMTVNPGFGGQEFLTPVLSKIAEIRRRLDEIGSEAWLEVDGGITSETVAAAYQAGARAFVAGTSIFKYPTGISTGINALRKQILP